MQEEDRTKVKRCRWIYPFNYNTDHRALVVKIGDEGRWVKPYIWKRSNIPDNIKALSVAE